jgi:hypothetical protein
MALTRSELKMLVKDLMVEILSEGLGNVQALKTTRPGGVPIAGAVREGRQPGRRRPEYDARLDAPLAGGRKPTDHLKDQIRLNAGGNSVMEQILADTAMTTLPKLVGDRRLGAQSLDEGASGGAATARGQGIPQVEQINGRPEEVFGEETASRWADLAFSEPKKLA